MPLNYNLTFALTKFLGSRVVEMEDQEGFMERGIFIPLDMNGLHVTKKGNVNAYAFVSERMGVSVDGSSHYIRLKVPQESLKAIKKLGYELPFIGSMTPMNHTTKYQYDKMKEMKHVNVNNINRCEENEYTDV